MTTTKLERTLTRLGKLPPHRIAKFLEKREIKGQNSDSLFCPVACYLKATCGFPVYAKYDYVVPVYEPYPIPTPTKVRIFMRRFDRGGFPELEA